MIRSMSISDLRLSEGAALCSVCSSYVYPMDAHINLDGSKFHLSCSKCDHCHCQLTIYNFVKIKNDGYTAVGDYILLCTTHQSQIPTVKPFLRKKGEDKTSDSVPTDPSASTKAEETRVSCLLSNLSEHETIKIENESQSKNDNQNATPNVEDPNAVVVNLNMIPIPDEVVIEDVSAPVAPSQIVVAPKLKTALFIPPPIEQLFIPPIELSVPETSEPNDTAILHSTSSEGDRSMSPLTASPPRVEAVRSTRTNKTRNPVNPKVAGTSPRISASSPKVSKINDNKRLLQQKIEAERDKRRTGGHGRVTVNLQTTSMRSIIRDVARSSSAPTSRLKPAAATSTSTTTTTTTTTTQSSSRN